jgi:hypothetical protein
MAISRTATRRRATKAMGEVFISTTGLGDSIESRNLCLEIENRETSCYLQKYGLGCGEGRQNRDPNGFPKGRLCDPLALASDGESAWVKNGETKWQSTH